ncbi:MAG: lytic transglycosylase protein [Belnapia sp.]|nr:lytic transglycosylase protein [Belnapia sp.]
MIFCDPFPRRQLVQQYGHSVRLGLAAMLLLLPAFALAASPTPRAPLPGERCVSAIDAAERRMQLPSQLLRSIALVESGRPDPTTGQVLPWPWTINVAGTGYFFATPDEAVAAVRDFQAKGVKSIDVGCAQVNLMYHPAAFDSIERAFDPQANADYAARFLKSLYASTSNWPLAAAAYHSQTAERGHAYARKVMAIWPSAARYGTLPSTPGLGMAASPDYSMYLPEFAARLRRMDEDRAKRDGAGALIQSAWAHRLPGLPELGASASNPPTTNRRRSLDTQNSLAMQLGR